MKMPTCPRPTERALGFTLVEMLVVLTVLGLLAAMLAATMGREPDRLARQKAAQTLRAAFAEARLEARRTGRTARVEPAALVEESRIANPAFPAAGGSILFYPDGSTSGGTVRLGEARLLEVDWLTGEVKDG